MHKYAFYLLYVLHAWICMTVNMPWYADLNMQKYAQNMQQYAVLNMQEILTSTQIRNMQYMCIISLNSNMQKYHMHKYAINMHKICKTKYAPKCILKICKNMYVLCKYMHYVWMCIRVNMSLYANLNMQKYLKICKKYA